MAWVSKSSLSERGRTFGPACQLRGAIFERTRTSTRRPCLGSQTPRPPSPMAAGCGAMSAPRHPWLCRYAASGVAVGGAWIRCRARHVGRCCGGCRPHRGLVLVWTAQALWVVSLHLWMMVLRGLAPCLVTSGRGMSMFIINVSCVVDAAL
jgi:hypothetical protein